MTPSPSPSIAEAQAVASAADWWIVWLTAIGIVATLFIAFLTLRANQRADASRTVAESAQVQALEASARAYNDSAEATQKQVEALAELVALTNDRTAAAPTAHSGPAVTWVLERDRLGKNRWLVRNAGTESARDVTLRGVSPQDQVDLMVLFDGAMDVTPENSLNFAIWKSMASPAATMIEIRWREEDDEEHSTRMVVV